MKARAIFGGAILLVALTACGKVGPLEPAVGQAPPSKAFGQTEATKSEDLLTASEQARPGRSDELMRRSERRIDDPFDLPPGSEPKPVENSKPADPAKPE